MESSSLSLDWRLSHKAIRPQQDSTETLLVTLKAGEIQLQERPPVTLMLCVDTSGSMMGRPLELVLESIRLMVEQLTPHDRMGLVTFSERVKLVTEPRPLDAEGRGFFMGVLTGIQAAGSTNMELGLRTALEKMPALRAEEVGRLILLSDGKPNRGVTDADALAQILQEGRRGYTLSGFGYGLEHDEDLMNLLARSGGGGYAYIEGAETAPLAFALELGSLFSLAATHISLLFRPGRGNALLQSRGGQQAEFTERGMAIYMPDMIARQTAHLLLELRLRPQESSGRHRLGDLELTYTLPGKQKQEVSHLQSLTCAIDSQAEELELDAEVGQRILLAEVAETWQAARQLADQKQYIEAIHRLMPARDSLQRSSAFEVEGGEVRNWYEQIVDEIAILSQLPDRERYRSLRKAAVSEMPEPTGAFRRKNTTMVGANPVQQELLSDLMKRQGWILHAYVEVLESPLPDETPSIGETFPLFGEASAGRIAPCEIVLPHSTVSKRHVRFVPTPGGYLLVDLMSTNQPHINNEPVQGPTLLRDGDRIQIGRFLLEFHSGMAPSLQPPPEQD